MKKAIKILGTLLCAVVLFFNLSINGKGSAGDTNLSTLMNKADAVCYESTFGPDFNFGRCNVYSENCYSQFELGDCDPTQWQ